MSTKEPDTSARNSRQLTIFYRCGSGRYRDEFGVCRYYSTWYHWGRWVFAGVAILLILLVFASLLYAPFLSTFYMFETE